jgi:flagellar hook-associated protein 2
MEIGGLISGLDTTTLIDQLISIERKPVLLMNDNISKLQKQKDAWRDINTRLSNLLTKLQELQKADTFQLQKTTSSDENVVKASSKGGNLSGTYKVEVLKLATATTVSSNTTLSKGIDPDVALNKAGFSIVPTSGTFSINGVEISIDAGTETLNDVLAKINASGAGVTATYDALNDKIQLTSENAIQLGSGADTSNFLQATKILAQGDGTTTAVESSGKLGALKLGETVENSRLNTNFGSTTGTLTINGVEITYDVSTDSLRSIINRINESKANVVLSYDNFNDRFTLTAKDTGSKTIALKDSGDLLQALGLTGPQNLGSNAQFKINDGAVLSSTSNTVTGIMEGLQLNLQKEGTATVTVEQDLDSIYNKIKAVIDQYNSVASFINTKLSKGGDLQGDGTLMRIQSTLRQKLTGLVSGVEGDFKHLNAIGIKADKTGIFSIDETKLKEALRTKSLSVQDLFNNDNGVVKRLSEYVDFLTKSGNGLISEKQKTYESRIEDLNESIEKFEARLELRRKSLVAQFTAMEKTMSNLINQSSWLSSQVSQLSSWSSSNR